MLDKKVVENFLFEELDEAQMQIPKGINRKKLVEAFCIFTEDDYYEWLKDNFKSFFQSRQSRLELDKKMHSKV